MNIWIINHHGARPGRHSNFSRILASRGHAVKLFSSSFLHNNYKELIDYEKKYFYKISLEDGYERIWIKTPPYYNNGIGRIFNQLVFTFRAMVIGKKFKSPDVIIGSSVHLFAAWAGYWLASKFKVPFIFEVRDLWPQTLVDMGLLKEKSIITILFRKLELFLYKKADKIITVLPNGNDYISNLGVSNEKIIYIPNGIDINWFDRCIQENKMNPQLEQFFETNKDKLIFAYTGAHGLANGLETVIDAASMLQNQGENKIKILLVGDGPQKEYLKNKSEELGLDNVFFNNAISKDKVPVILNKSDCLIFHLQDTDVFKYGISSNKLFDYMASEKPMLFAAATSFDFAKESGCGISIEPDNPGKLAEAMISFKNMSTKQKEEMGVNARKFVKQYHDFEVLVDKLESTMRDNGTTT